MEHRNAKTVYYFGAPDVPLWRPILSCIAFPLFDALSQHQLGNLSSAAGKLRCKEGPALWKSARVDHSARLSHDERNPRSGVPPRT